MADITQDPLCQETLAHSLKDQDEDLGTGSLSGRSVIDSFTGCQATNTQDLRYVTYRNGFLLIR